MLQELQITPNHANFEYFGATFMFADSKRLDLQGEPFWWE